MCIRDSYYLIGFSLKHQKIAHFRVDRLTGVETLETVSYTHLDVYKRQNDDTGMTYPLILAKIPVKNPWEIFAYLPFGNWNECPDRCV